MSTNNKQLSLFTKEEMEELKEHSKNLIENNSLQDQVDKYGYPITEEELIKTIEEFFIKESGSPEIRLWTWRGGYRIFHEEMKKAIKNLKNDNTRSL